MYGLPNSPIQFGTKPAKKKPGRKTDWSKFCEKQSDLFAGEKFLAELEHKFPVLTAFKRDSCDAQD